jgi:3-hydroxybutyryl-CoA dehydrogenase
MKLNRIAVIGAGNMGHQIALHAAISGFNVKCFDINPETLNKANQFVDEYLPGRVTKERLTQAEADVARSNIQFVDNLETAVSDADYVIEAVLEVLDIKRELFKDVDRLAPPHAILASNSSAIVSSKIADVTSRPEKVLNLHFFNPALVMKLVEVVQGPHVSDETLQISMALCKQLNKEPVHLKKKWKDFC